MDELIQASESDTQIYSVSQLNQEARLLMESHFPNIWVSGEISNFARPASGHWYFSLKDASSQVRCAMFKFKNAKLNFIPENGTQVLLRGKVSLYEGRGDYQLIADYMEEAGDGLLRREFEKLKQKLFQQGLFDAAAKKTLPTFAKTIGIVTSDTGAALRDILHVLKRRFSALPIIIYPTQVQGKQSATSIAHAIQLANQHKACDVLILARGGGSLEDLWGFNEENVALAIFNSEIPIISGIGHEVDFTIADFVADMRAPTPSAAAELASPDKQALLHHYNMILDRLLRSITGFLSYHRTTLTHLRRRLQSPNQRLEQYAQRCDNLENRLHRAWQHYFENYVTQHHTLQHRLKNQNPTHRIQRFKQELQNLQKQLQRSIWHQLQKQQQNLSSLGRALDAISPLATLDRGYAIVRNNKEVIIRDAMSCPVGSQVNIRLHKGELVCKVEQVKNK